MEIRTKFNVGDKVYVIYYNTNEKKYFIKEMKIYYITCYVEYDNIIKINYSIHDLQWENDTDCVAEEYCFSTKEEAIKECERRNAQK